MIDNPSVKVTIILEELILEARNMVFMIRAFADAKEKYELPTVELDDFTSFPDGK